MLVVALIANDPHCPTNHRADTMGWPPDAIMHQCATDSVAAPMPRVLRPWHAGSISRTDTCLVLVGHFEVSQYVLQREPTAWVNLYCPYSTRVNTILNDTLKVVKHENFGGSDAKVIAELPHMVSLAEVFCLLAIISPSPWVVPDDFERRSNLFAKARL